jgi:hypothetical protein
MAASLFSSERFRGHSRCAPRWRRVTPKCCDNQHQTVISVSLALASGQKAMALWLGFGFFWLWLDVALAWPGI